MSNVPKLRFKEFSGEWHKRHLKSITNKIGSGSTPNGGEKVYKDFGIPFIRSQNINNDKLLLDSVVFIDNETHISMKNSSVKPNDILLNITGGSIGRSCVVPDSFKEGNVNQHVCIVRINNNNISNFIQLFLASFKGQKLIYQGQTGSGREGINFQSIGSFNIHLPQKEEQEKIASFLSQLDSKIEQLTKKEELLEQYKKGIMQKIFSQEIRFKDDDGNEFPEWEEKKLGEILYKKSSNISANKLENNIGDYKIYGASGHIKGVDFFTEDESYIGIVKDGAGVGRTFLCDKNSSVLGTLDILKNKSISNLDFSYYLLTKLKIEKYIIGSTIPHVYFKDYSNEKFVIPSLKEQTKIANFLSAIDNKIEANKKQLDKTKEFKKALLQQMFV